MSSDIDFILKVSLNSETVEKLHAFSELLDKDTTTILQEALQQYFEREEKRLLEKKLSEKDPMTNFDFDEFWDGIDI